MVYRFEWDEPKATHNQAKHGIRFSDAVTVLRDPHALTRYDEEHSLGEDRWITLGVAQNGVPIVLVHTWTSIDEETVVIRVISARKATKRERESYER